jgi:hypothetical protein
MNFASHIYGAL